MTEEEKNEIRREVLNDLINVFQSAATDIRHRWEGGEAGIGTKTAGEILAKLRRYRQERIPHPPDQVEETDGVM